MKLGAARRRFFGHMWSAGLELESLTPAATLNLMLRTYRRDRFHGCDPAAGGDFLVCRWDLRTRERGDWFEFELARHLHDCSDDRRRPRRLRLILSYAPDSHLRRLAPGILTCDSPDGAAAFRETIANTTAFQLIANTLPRHTDIPFRATPLGTM